MTNMFSGHMQVSYICNYKDFHERKLPNIDHSINSHNNTNSLPITFIQKNEKPKNFSSPFFLQAIYDTNLLQLIPRLFTISTNNGSSKFNIELLINTSLVISNFYKENPQNLEYHLDIEDKENILEKISLLYRGEIVTFDPDSFFTCQQITDLLNISCFPSPLLSPNKRNNKFGFGFSFPVFQPQAKPQPQEEKPIDVQIEASSFLMQEVPCTFEIKTNKNDYKCNIYGIHTSAVINGLLKADPKKDVYIYEFEDEFNEFQDICDFFNLKKVNITKDNIESIKQIAEDLEIKFILERIDESFNEIEKISKIIDDEQPNIDSIDDLYELLYQHKNKQTVESVANSILTTKWSKKEENVLEFAAIVLEVAKTDFSRHQFLIDLLIKLNKESNEKNQLKLLMPTIVKTLMNITFFSKRNINKYKGYLSYYGFIYKLYKSGFISEEEIKEKIVNYYDNFSNICFNAWFLPEIIDYWHIENINVLLKSYFNEYIDFINSYFPSRIEEYKTMRDKGIPDDKLTMIIREDDVDSLQSIISNGISDFSKSFVPFNLFEASIANGRTRYINYAAAYGSVKCFKYFLLNHVPIDVDTLSYSILGGNNEIIKIVDQRKNEIININNLMNRTFQDRIEYAIALHRNDLFDWIFEQSSEINNDEESVNFERIALLSAYHGNIHSFTEVLDKELSVEGVFDKVIKFSSKFGFYSIVQMISKILEGRIDILKLYLYNCKNTQLFKGNSLVYFGNIFIFKSFSNFIDEQALYDSLLSSIAYEHEKIIKYILNNNELFTKIKTFRSYSEDITFNAFRVKNNESFNKIETIPSYIKDIMYNAVRVKNYELFKYLYDEIKKTNQDNLQQSLLENISIYNNFKNVKTVAEDILANNPKQDFTKYFYNAVRKNSIETCKYFVEKNVLIDFDQIILIDIDHVSINEEILSIILHKVNHETKVKLLTILPQAIEKRKYKLVELLINEGASFDDALITAVRSNDLQTVDMILKYNSRPSYINKVSKNGTCLIIAVKNKNLGIVKRLLSIPGINPSLYCFNNETALTESVKIMDLDILNAILDFYGDKIQQNRWMINEAIKSFIDVKQKTSSVFGRSPDQHINQDNKKRVNILSRLLEIPNIDFNEHYGSNTFLTYACAKNDIYLVETLLQSGNIDVNLYESNCGNTPLLIAIENKNYDIAKLLIEYPQTDINRVNYDMNSPLVCAVSKEFDSIVNLIINSDKFDPIESRLDYAFYISSNKIAKILFSLKQLNVNYESFVSSTNSKAILAKKEIETPLIKNVMKKNMELVDMIIHHPSFDKNISQARNAIFYAISNNDINIFKELIPLFDNDINMCDFVGNSIFSKAISECSDIILSEIIKNENFDSTKYNLLESFVQCYKRMPKNTYGFSFHDTPTNKQANNPVNCMKILYEYDKNHGNLIDTKKLLPYGKSFFTLMGSKSSFDYDITKFLLDIGVDPCKEDETGISPIINAIQIGSKDCLCALLETNKIDLSEKITVSYFYNHYFTNNNDTKKNTTYLHFAVMHDTQVFSEILNRGVIDINATDENGNTPLILAARYRKAEIVKILFQKVELDYLHRNNDGFDAIQAADSTEKSEINANLNSSAYKYKLLNIIEQSSDDSD